MNNFCKVATTLGSVVIVIAASAYLVDHHQCRQIDYQQVTSEVPKTWVLSRAQCLDVAHGVKLRGYARDLSVRPASMRTADDKS